MNNALKGPIRWPKTTGLILVGTIHRLPRGEEILFRVLEQLCPAAISLEMSRFSYRFRQRQRHRWLKRLQELAFALDKAALEGLHSLIDLPFEFKAAQRYAREHRLPLYLTDLSAPAQKYLRQLDHLLETGDISFLKRLGQALWEEPQKHLSLAPRAIQDPERFFLHFNWRWKPEDLRRDSILAARIRRRLRHRTPLVHIGGYEHLLPYPGRLLKQLEDLKPAVIFLWERNPAKEADG